MNEMHGYLGVLVAILAWGSYMVPLKSYHKISPLWFQGWLSVGVGFSSLAIGAWRGFPSFSLWGIFAGLLWTIGAASSFLAVRHEGLSGASTRWMGTGILVSFAIGLFLLGEKVRLELAVPGVLLLIGGLFVVSKAGEDPKNNVKMSIFRYWRSVGAGCIFGSYLLPMQLAQINPMDFVAPMGTGIMLGGILLLSRRPPSHTGLLPICIGCGLAWNLANLGSLIAVQTIGFAVGFPLTQLALLVSISWGIFLFGESPLPRQRRFLMLAAIFLLIGAALLGLSRV